MGEGGVSPVGKIRGWSSWWMSVVNIRSKREGGSFGQNLEKKIGSGYDTRFWEEVWAGKSTLKNQFSKLFQLSIGKDRKVREMGTWVGGTWERKWDWRRALFDR